jgi:Flp pilus assembly protein TadD
MPTVTETLRQAVNLHQAGSLGEAEKCYRAILAVQPRCADAHHLLGLLAHQARRSADAITHIQAAIEIDHAQPTYYHNLSLAALAADHSELAIEAARRAVMLDPKNGSLHDNLGHVLLTDGQPEEAACALREAARLAPNSPKVRTNFSAALCQSGCVDEAVQEAQRAVTLASGDARAHNALALALQQQGHADAAAISFDRSVQLDGSDTELQWNRTLSQLSRGKWSEGWSQYDLRSRQAGQHVRHLPRPTWAGEPLSGKTILVYAEQGIGDEIMFASCLPDVVDQAGRCVVECNDRLTGLMARSFPGAYVVGHQNDEQLSRLCDQQNVDWVIAAGGLPRWLRPTVESFPTRRSYLSADPNRVASWKQRLDELGAGMKVGISWRGGAVAATRRHRSTSLQQWQPIFQIPDTTFVNLQYGDCREELAVAQQQGMRIHQWPDADPLGDLDELAALIASLDVVVSVANATVHLAGALGGEVWTMLGVSPSWRWLLDRGDTPWYESMRLYRQPRHGDWDSVLRRIAEQLSRRATGESLVSGGSLV